MPRSLLPTVSHLSGEEEEPGERPTMFSGRSGSGAEDIQPQHPNHNPGGITFSVHSHTGEKQRHEGCLACTCDVKCFINVYNSLEVQ